MIDHELTDPAGGALTITLDHQGVWITATEDRDEVTVGPFPARALRASFDMGDDLADGGVTAAVIEAEVVSPELARSLVQENTELRARIGRVEEARDLYSRDALTEERLHGEARRFALAWKETARREFQYRVLARTGRGFWYGIARKFEESRDAAVQERDEAKAFATLWKRTAREQVRRTRNIAGRTRVQADYIGRLRREVEKARQQGDVDPLPIIDEVARQDGVIHELRKQLEADKRAASASPRPLTADDITDEMVDRAWRAWLDGDNSDVHSFRLAVMAALTPPPSRPEGAEGLAEVLRTFPGTLAGIRDISDHLASRGVRVTGAES